MNFRTLFSLLSSPNLIISQPFGGNLRTKLQTVHKAVKTMINCNSKMLLNAGLLLIIKCFILS